MSRVSLVVAALLLTGCDLFDRSVTEETVTANKTAAKRDRNLRQTCASETTYAQLKALLFEQAARVRGGETAALDQLADASVVRMESPRVQSRDNELNVTVCAARLVLELPPGGENAFDGERRMSAQVQYSAQAAADGSGLAYQMEGAEPIVYRLATIGGMMRTAARTATPAQPAVRPATPRAPASPPAPPPTQTAERAPAPAPPPVVEPRRVPAPPVPTPAQPTAAAETMAQPSFNCRSARTPSERRVCGSAGLAARDRRMASAFYSALAEADEGRRRALRASRDRFLAFRERCPDDACIAQAYDDRVAEIRDIMSGR